MSTELAMDAAMVKSEYFSGEPGANAFAGRRIHFVGIGGSGMSGLAQMLLQAGAIVSGSDQTASETTQRLARLGCKIQDGAEQGALDPQVEVLVYSAAIRPDHPELVAAQQRGATVMKYAQMLGEAMNLRCGIAIAGTHGKSTTTALTSYVLSKAGLDPSYVIGAVAPQLGGSSHGGLGELFVVEACEYDRSFLNLRPRIAAVLNIEEDHLDYYRNLDEIIGAFGEFVGNVPAQGRVLVHHQDSACARAAASAKAPVETFGIGVGATWQAVDISQHDQRIDFGVRYKGEVTGELSLRIAGRHNVLNALVAAAISHHSGVGWPDIAAAVETFTGAHRRSEHLGEFAGITVIDDYGHHPTEIRATLMALREHYNPRRLICVFQPHQHSRTRFLLNDFARSFSSADITVVPDIFFVRDSEKDRREIRADQLVELIKSNGRTAVYIPTFKEIVTYLGQELVHGDLVVSMGAGPVWEVTHELVRRLR